MALIGADKFELSAIIRVIRGGLVHSVGFARKQKSAGSGEV
jgi:hypothetical protein